VVGFVVGSCSDWILRGVCFWECFCGYILFLRVFLRVFLGVLRILAYISTPETNFESISGYFLFLKLFLRAFSGCFLFFKLPSRVFLRVFYRSFLFSRLPSRVFLRVFADISASETDSRECFTPASATATATANSGDANGIFDRNRPARHCNRRAQPRGSHNPPQPIRSLCAASPVPCGFAARHVAGPPVPPSLLLWARSARPARTARSSLARRHRATQSPGCQRELRSRPVLARTSRAMRAPWYRVKLTNRNQRKNPRQSKSPETPSQSLNRTAPPFSLDR
jgi:hypothetical protein